MQTFKKLFAFMLIALAIAPVLAMEPIKEEEMRAPLAPMLAALGEEPAKNDDTVARVEMKDEANSDEENKTPSPTKKNKASELVDQIKGLIGRLGNKSKVEVETVPVVNSLAGVHPILLIQGGEDAVEVSLEAPAEAIVIEEEAVEPARMTLPVSDDENSVEEVVEPSRISLPESDDESSVEEAVNPANTALPESDDEDSVEEGLEASVKADAESVESEEADVSFNDFPELFSQGADATETITQNESIPAKLASYYSCGYLAKDGKRDFSFANLREHKLKLMATFGLCAATVSAIGGAVYGIYNKFFKKPQAAVVNVDKAKAVESVEPKVQSVTAPVVVKPAATKQVAKKARSSRKSSLVRAKCRGKKSCSSKGCK